MKFRHVGLVVLDHEYSLEFWVGVMGFSVKSSCREKGPFIDSLIGDYGIDVRTSKLSDQSEDVILELLTFESQDLRHYWGGDYRTPGLTHIALTVSDISATIEKISNFFERPVASFAEEPSSGLRAKYVTGPEGVILELVQPC